MAGRLRRTGLNGAGAFAAAALLALAAWPPAAAAASAAGSPDVTALEAKIAQQATLADLLSLAHHSSPMIRAARAEWEAAVEKYRVETAWPDPEIMAEGMYPADELGDTATPMDWSLGLTQRVPLPGRQRTAGNVTRAEAKVARLKLDASVRDVTYDVRRSAWELRYLAEARQIARGQQELVGKLVASGAAAYAGERASLYEVMKARSQSGQLDYDVLLLEEAERTERARLNALLDRLPDAPVGPIAGADAGPLAFSVTEIDALAEANYEGLLVARAEVERAEAMAKLVRYETFPEVTLGVSYGKSDEINQVGVQAGLMLPLWAGKNAGRRAGAQADVEKMRAEYRTQLNELRAKLRDVVFRLKNAERLERLYRDDLVPQAERAVEMAEQRLRQGQGSLGDAAEARSAWYSFRLALERARADRGTLLASLESLAGRSLTRRDGFGGAPPEGAK